jgi:D-3-phosphoglycerate dehydrogenase
MNVLFHDILRKLPLGNAEPVETLDQLLAAADYVTLHVPETPLTRGMIGAPQLARMKRGSYLLNLSRGSVVDLAALKVALADGHLAGAALDVYPDEPQKSGAWSVGELAGADNLILTPHVGGSTLEAQRNIGREVSNTLIRFTNTGGTAGAVNFPEVEPIGAPGSHRVLNVHRNVPGVLRDINRIVAGMDANVLAQLLATRDEIGYLVMDVDPSLSREVKRRIDRLDESIRTRLLF